jgi:hypothetical protein
MSSGKKIIVGAILIVAGTAVAAALVLDAQTKREAVIPAGLPIVAVLQQRVSTESARLGDAVQLRMTEPLRVDSETVIPAGLTIRGDVAAVRRGGRMGGAPEIAVHFTKLDLDGTSYPIEADLFRVTGHSDAGKSAAQVGGGALAGGLVGGLLGGAGGIAKGAVVGAVLGTGVAVATKGQDLVLPAGQKIRIRLSSPVSVQYVVRSEETTKAT